VVSDATVAIMTAPVLIPSTHSSRPPCPGPARRHISGPCAV